jgi:hypothetical protein
MMMNSLLDFLQQVCASISTGVFGNWTLGVYGTPGRGMNVVEIAEIAN